PFWSGLNDRLAHLFRLESSVSLHVLFGLGVTLIAIGRLGWRAWEGDRILRADDGRSTRSSPCWVCGCSSAEVRSEAASHTDETSDSMKRRSAMKTMCVLRLLIVAVVVASAAAAEEPDAE